METNKPETNKKSDLDKFADQIGEGQRKFDLIPDDLQRFFGTRSYQSTDSEVVQRFFKIKDCELNELKLISVSFLQELENNMVLLYGFYSYEGMPEGMNWKSFILTATPNYGLDYHEICEQHNGVDMQYSEEELLDVGLIEVTVLSRIQPSYKYIIEVNDCGELNISDPQPFIEKKARSPFLKPATGA